MWTDWTTSGNSDDTAVTTSGNSTAEKLKERQNKIKDVYASFGLSEEAQDSQIQTRYEQFKKLFRPNFYTYVWCIMFFFEICFFYVLLKFLKPLFSSLFCFCLFVCLIVHWWCILWCRYAKNPEKLEEIKQSFAALGIEEKHDTAADKIKHLYANLGFSDDKATDEEIEANYDLCKKMFRPNSIHVWYMRFLGFFLMFSWNFSNHFFHVR